jgi:hypothetical protein
MGLTMSVDSIPAWIHEIPTSGSHVILGVSSFVLVFLAAMDPVIKSMILHLGHGKSLTRLAVLRSLWTPKIGDHGGCAEKRAVVPGSLA